MTVSTLTQQAPPLDALSRAPRALPLPTTGGQNVDVAFMTVHTLFILVVLPINLFRLNHSSLSLVARINSWLRNSYLG